MKSHNFNPTKFDGLLVNNNKTMNSVICDLGKVTMSPPNQSCHFAPTNLRGNKKLRATLEISLYGNLVRVGINTY